MISSRTKNTARGPKKSWFSVLRSPWTVACATAVVVLGPSAVTASALEHANSAPLHGASAPEHPRPDTDRHHHIQSYTTEQYAYLPRTTSRVLRG
ncbi:hypothetical protein [Streptomyces sp. NPDC012510]|jgi:hypothetical protein|uniref:hypothetical protein n=1 Tax=Streptomyces sp. NPDC012510 TaxID=3364838 RepID=UPI0036EF9C32